jgi:hypothetical protein
MMGVYSRDAWGNITISHSFTECQNKASFLELIMKPSALAVVAGIQ